MFVLATKQTHNSASLRYKFIHNQSKNDDTNTLDIFAAYFKENVQTGGNDDPKKLKIDSRIILLASYQRWSNFKYRKYNITILEKNIIQHLLKMNHDSFLQACEQMRKDENLDGMIFQKDCLENSTKIQSP